MSPRYWVRSLRAEPGHELAPGWDIAALKRDHAGVMGTLAAYQSTLAPGVSPHEPHRHEEDEIIVLLAGELDVLADERTERIGAGSFFFHAAGERHTVRATGQVPAQFVVLKWRGGEAEANVKSPGTFIHRSGDSATGEHYATVFDAVLRDGTRLRALDCALTAADGYPPHRHDHEVVLVLREGCLRDIAHEVAAPAVICYGPQVPHCHRPGDAGTSFFAFEFHPAASGGG